jgi:serine protease Do
MMTTGRSAKKVAILALCVSVMVVAGFGLAAVPGIGQDTDLEGLVYEESTQQHPVDPYSLEGRIIGVIEKVSPAVVSISTERTVAAPFDQRYMESPFGDFDEFFRRFFEYYPRQEVPQRGLGSGMIISDTGYILTNEHVIHEVDEGSIKVALSDNKIYTAEIVGTDAESDIAVLKIEGYGFPHVVLGDSGAIRVGQWAIALGNPFGYALSELNKQYEPTVTVGVVSATGRALQAGGAMGESRTYPDLIQTDAAINPGNSGGPLVNIHGEVIGINTAIFSPSGGSIGIGFAIPANKAKLLIDSLVKYGEIRWPWIGIYMQELTDELAQQFGIDKGILVADVVPGSPAAEAGIEPGDIVTAVNGVPTIAQVDVIEEVRKARIGDMVTVQLYRDGQDIELEMVTAPRPKDVTALRGDTEQEEEAGEELTFTSEMLGLEVADITPALKGEYKLQENEGVVVTDVRIGSSAAGVGIAPGDIIMSVNRQTISSVAQFEEILSAMSPGDAVLLRIRHGAWTIWVTIPTEES